MRVPFLTLTVLLATLPVLGCRTAAPENPRHVLVASRAGSSFFHAARGEVLYYADPEAPPSAPLGGATKDPSSPQGPTRYSANSTEGGTFLVSSNSDLVRVHPTGELHRVNRFPGPLPTFLAVRGRLALELDPRRLRIRRARDLEILYRFSPSRWLESRGEGRFLGLCPTVTNEDAETALQFLVAGQATSEDGEALSTVEFWELELPSGLLEETPPPTPPLWTPRRLGTTSGFDAHVCVGRDATLWGAGSALRMPSAPRESPDSGDEEPEPELRLEVYSWSPSDPNGSLGFSLPWPSALNEEGEHTPLFGIHRMDVHPGKIGLLHQGGTLRVLRPDGALLEQLEGVEAFAFLETGDLVFVPRSGEDEPLAGPRVEPLAMPGEPSTDGGS